MGKKGGVGRSTIQNAYFDKCKDSKIIVHCQPFGWEGDFRTFEALASGALVISDKSYSMQHHTYPLIDGVRDREGAPHEGSTARPESLKVQKFSHHHHRGLAFAPSL